MGALGVDEVIVAPEDGSARRTAPAETQAFLALSETLAKAPGRAVQRLVDLAMKLTGADSAGVSLEEEGGEPIFRWIATAGEFSRYLGGTMPRHFSPCGTVVDRGRTLVMRDPARAFPYVAELHAPVCAVLLVPFTKGGRYVGTVWVAAHQPQKQFTSEDVQMVERLTTFSTSILDALRPPRGKPAAA